jgi:HAD superfamily hydrolase (TIGR01509 family)
MRTILVDAVDTFVIEGKGVYQPMFDLLEKYPNRKIILTNADEQQMVTFGLTNLPYELFTLKHNPEKTDPEYFKTMLKNFNLELNDVIYFEHNPEAVSSAKSLGITSYQYDPETKDMEALKSFLDSNL